MKKVAVFILFVLLTTLYASDKEEFCKMKPNGYICKENQTLPSDYKALSDNANNCLIRYSPRQNLGDVWLRYLNDEQLTKCAQYFTKESLKNAWITRRSFELREK